MGDKGKCQVCPKLCSTSCSWCRNIFYCCKEHQKQDWPSHKKSCAKKKFQLAEDEKVGRCIVANEDIKPDFILFKEKPLLLGFKTEKYSTEDSICLGCYRELKDDDDEDQECESCGLSVCNSKCASQYFHKNFECKLFSERKEIEDATAEKNVRETFLQNIFMFRCILLKRLNEKLWNELMTYQSNEEFRGDINNLEKTARLYEEMKTILEQIDHPTLPPSILYKPDVHKLLGIMDTNCVECRISPNVEIVMLLSLFCRMEHSCVPNTKFYLTRCPLEKRSPLEVYCRSAVKIKNGEHLTTMYTNILWNTEKRRENLKKTKCFWCNCPRCSDPSELGSNFSTLLCPLPKCKAFSVPVPKSPETPEDFHWQCTSSECKKICEPYQVKKVDTKLSEMVGKMIPTAKNYKQMLSTIAELVHPDYYLNFIVNHSLIQMYGRDDGTQNDKDVLEEKLTLCNRLLATVKKLDPGLARMNIYAAVVFFEMHSAILALAGGEVDDDFMILRKNSETVKLAKVYLQKCIDCFQYELMDLPEVKLRILATKKMEYLNMIMTHRFE